MHSCTQPVVLKCGCLHGTLRMGQRFFTVVLPHPIFCLLSCWKGRGEIFSYSFCCWRPSLRSICITVVAIPDRNKEERSIWAYSPRGCGLGKFLFLEHEAGFSHAGRPRSRKDPGCHLSRAAISHLLLPGRCQLPKSFQNGSISWEARIQNMWAFQTQTIMPSVLS